MTTVIWLLGALAALTVTVSAQTTGKTPGDERLSQHYPQSSVQTTRKSSLQTAIDEVGHALKHYQGTLALLRDLPEFDSILRRDSQLVLSGTNTVAWLRAKADLEGTVVPSEFAGLLDSIEGCATDAASSAGLLAAAAATTRSERELKMEMDLVDTSEQLRNAANHLRRSLRSYLQSEKVRHVV
jgi:hypothetical protein